MAGKKATTKLTFAVTVPQLDGLTIKDMRAYIIESLMTNTKAAKLDSDSFDTVKVHLLNKETHYGQR